MEAYLEKLLATHREQLSKLTDDLNAAESKNKDLREKIKNQESSIKALRAALNEREQIIAELQSDIEEMGPKINMLVAAVSMLENSANADELAFLSSTDLGVEGALLFGVGIDPLMLSDIPALKRYLYMLKCHAKSSFKLNHFAPASRGDLAAFGQKVCAFLSAQDANLRGVVELLAPNLIDNFTLLRFFGTSDISAALARFVSGEE